MAIDERLLVPIATVLEELSLKALLFNELLVTIEELVVTIAELVMIKELTAVEVATLEEPSMEAILSEELELPRKLDAVFCGGFSLLALSLEQADKKSAAAHKGKEVKILFMIEPPRMGIDK